MNKLNILQIMDLASKVEKTEWISVLINLNNSGQIERFFEMINQSELLKSTLSNTKLQNTR